MLFVCPRRPWWAECEGVLWRTQQCVGDRRQWKFVGLGTQKPVRVSTSYPTASLSDLHASGTENAQWRVVSVVEATRNRNYFACGVEWWPRGRVSVKLRLLNHRITLHLNRSIITVYSSVCDSNDTDDMASISVRRQSSTASTDSGRGGDVGSSRLTSNTSMRRERLTAGSAFGSQRTLWSVSIVFN